MSSCPGLHCPGCGKGEALAATGSVITGALMIWLIIDFLWLVAVIVGLAVAVSAAVLIWMARRGADVAVVSHAALPPPHVTSPPSRPAEAIQGPVNFNFFGPLTREQLDEVDAIREAGYRVYDTYRRDQ